MGLCLLCIIHVVEYEAWVLSNILVLDRNLMIFNLWDHSGAEMSLDTEGIWTTLESEILVIA